MALSVLASCGVAEDRVPCPCFVYVLPEDGRPFSENSLFMSFKEGESVPDYVQNLKYAEGTPQERIVRVPKGMKMLAVAEGLSGMHLEGSCAFAEVSAECDPLMCWSRETDCRGERAVLPVRRTKHYVTVFFSFARDGQQPCGLRLRAKGNYSGLDLCSMRPVERSFILTPSPLDDSAYDYAFRVPRQGDDSLVLEILDAGSDAVVDVIRLGDVMKNDGFDWKAEILDDVSVRMDLVTEIFRVEVVEWKDDEKFVKI